MITVSATIAAFLKNYALVHSPRTADTYRFALDKFSEYLKGSGVSGEKSVKQIKGAHFLGFIDYLVDSQLSRSSMITYFSGVRAYQKYLQNEDYLVMSGKEQARIGEKVKALTKSVPQRLPETPSEATLDQIRAVIARSGSEIVRLRNDALLEFLYCTGGRVGEAHKLLVRDINLEEQTARVVGKGNKQRIVFISTVACDKFKLYLDARKDHKGTDPAFLSHDNKGVRALATRGMWKIVHELAQAVNVDGFHPHLYRHSFGTRMLDSTSDLALVQDLLGHSSPATTRIYADVAVSKKRQAVRNVYK